MRFVPGVGFEPTRSREQQGLGLPRLPFRHPGVGDRSTLPQVRRWFAKDPLEARAFGGSTASPIEPISPER